MNSEKSILIVDDDPAMVKIIARRCRDEFGFAARVCPDGLKALVEIGKAPPDLLILDVNMPALDGLTLCEKLAQDTSLGPIPVIMLTGRSDEQTVRNCQELGAHYAHKNSAMWSELKPMICELLELEHDRTPAAARTPQPRAAVPQQESPAAHQVLVIDDDPDISKALQIKLAQYGVKVLRAYSGMQGYWMALREKPALVITDYAMPDGYGNYVLGRLQSHAVTRDIPVIVLTGRTLEGKKNYALERELLSLGAQAFLTKPLDFETLIQILRRYLDLPATAGARPASVARAPNFA